MNARQRSDHERRMMLRARRLNVRDARKVLAARAARGWITRGLGKTAPSESCSAPDTLPP